MATVRVADDSNGGYLYIDYSFSANTSARTWSFSSSLVMQVPSGWTYGGWNYYCLNEGLLRKNGMSEMVSGAYTLATYSTSGSYNSNGDAPSIHLTWAFNVNTYVGYSCPHGAIDVRGSSIGPASTPPTGLTASLVDFGPDWADIAVSISSWGTPSGSASRYIEAAVLETSNYRDPYKAKKLYAKMSGTIHVANNSYDFGSITITPNTQYSYGGYVTNTAQTANTIGGQFTTLPAVPIINAVDQGHGVIDVTVTHVTEGSALTVTEEYSIDGGTTWNTIAGGAFTLNLSSQTVLTVRRSSTAGESSDTVTVTPSFTTAIYGSVLNKTVEIDKVYASVPGRNIASAEINSAVLQTSDADEFGEYLNSIRSMVKYINDFNYDITSLSLRYGGEYALKWDIDSTTAWTLIRDSDFDTFKNKCRLAGLRIEWTGTGDATGIPVAVTYSYDNNNYHKSKKIAKIYGSVEGKTKLVFEDVS